MNKVYFEGNIVGWLTDPQLELHQKMQKEYAEFYKMLSDKENELHSKMEKSAIDITDKCLEEMKLFQKTLEPALDVFMKYELISLLPRLNVKILRIEYYPESQTSINQL